MTTQEPTGRVVGDERARTYASNKDRRLWLRKDRTSPASRQVVFDPWFYEGKGSQLNPIKGEVRIAVAKAKPRQKAAFLVCDAARRCHAQLGSRR